MVSGPQTPVSEDRRSRRTWRSQRRVLLPLGVVWLFGVCVLAVAAQAKNPQRLFFDPSFSGPDAAWYVGVVSQLGMLCWAVAASSAAWSSWFAAHVGRRSAARFLGHGALATIVLLADDLFEIHVVAHSALGVPKVLMQAAVVAPAALWLAGHVGDVMRTRWPLLVAAVGALAGSLLVEQITGNSFSASATLAEDGAKFLGVLAWAAYFTLTSVDIARSVLRETHAPRHTEALSVATDPRGRATQTSPARSASVAPASSRAAGSSVRSTPFAEFLVAPTTGDGLQVDRSHAPAASAR